jgi:plastocyanin
MVMVKITGPSGNWAFMPQDVTIKLGTTVEWMNVSDAPHTSTSDTGVWDSKNISAMTGTYAFTFTGAGTYTYHCSYHTFMTGTITVSS